MATINGRTLAVQSGVLQTTWANMGIADVGTPDELARYPLHSVQIGSGTVAGPGNTFGGATVVLQGSDDGVIYFTLRDVLGNAVSATVAARFDLEDVPNFIRPSSSGGAGTNVTVIVTSKAVSG